VLFDVSLYYIFLIIYVYMVKRFYGL